MPEIFEACPKYLENNSNFGRHKYWNNFDSPKIFRACPKYVAVHGV